MSSLVLWIVMVLVCVLAAYIILRVYVPYYQHSKKLYKIPGPAPYPIIGNLLLVNFDRSGVIPFLKNLHDKFGPIVRIHAFGKSHVFLFDEKSVEKILGSTRYIKKSFDYNLLMPWLREGLLTSTGTKWHTRRKILTPTFHFKILEDYFPVFNKNAAILVKKLCEHIDEPVVILNDFITLCTLDIICETAMGTVINAQNGQEVEYVKAVQRISELYQDRQLRLWLYNDFVFQFSSIAREQRKVLKVLHGFSSKVIKQRRAEYRASKNDPEACEERVSKRRNLALLDLLIEISETEHELTDLDIREEVDTFMFEGHDTTSAALSWTLYLLGRHSDIQERVVKELKDIFGDSDRTPVLEDLGKMKYLEQVIKESLRLYPSVPAISRQLQQDTEIMGYNVPAGASVSISTLLYQRDPSLYPDPDKFDPDRFSPEAMQKRHPYYFLPFSAGPRSCIGQRFAIMEEKVILSTVLRNFRIESLDEPDDITLLMELILRPKDPLRFKLSPR